MNKYEPINGLWKVQYIHEKTESKNFDGFIRIIGNKVTTLKKEELNKKPTISNENYDYCILNLSYGNHYKILKFDLLFCIENDIKKMFKNKVLYQLSIESTKNLDTGFEILTMKGKTSTEHNVTFQRYSS